MGALINTALMRTVVAAGRLRQRFSEERGQDLLEYALIGGVIAAAIVGIGATLMLTGVTGMFTGIRDCIDFSGNCNPPG